MNEELTNEVLEAMKKCGGSDCSVCDAYNYCNGTSRDIVIEALATALLEERAKPKVWDGAPDGAIQAQIKWFAKNGYFSATKTYNRELPKTRVDEIVKETREKIRDYLFAKDGQKSSVIDEILKSALTKYAEELEGKE